ncbi:hypothetical protein OROHE_011063 [Orobanche hederae]
MLFTDRFPLSIFIIISGSRMWVMSEAVDLSQSTWFPDEKPTLVSDGCDPKVALEKAISDLEMELAAARTLQDSLLDSSPSSEELKIHGSAKNRKYLMAVGINSAFIS